MGENASEKGDMKALILIRSFTVRLILVFANERHSRYKSLSPYLKRIQPPMRLLNFAVFRV